MAANGINGIQNGTVTPQTLEGLEGVKIVENSKAQSPTSPSTANGTGFASLAQSTHATPSHGLSRGLTTGTASTVGGASGSFQVKSGLAQMLKGGVIMDVTNAAEARIAEEAGACSVMALERIPSDIRKEGGVARMSDPAMIKEIIDAVTIPVMAKCRIGHIAEAQILQACGVDFIDESEVLTPADPSLHIAKHAFKTPFVCGCKNLGEALRRISEGAAMIRTKGEAGTGNVIEAVRHQRMVMSDIRRAASMTDEELYHFAKEISAPYHLLKEVARLKKLPVVSFAAGGIATPADAALMMQLGCDGVFVGSAIFKAENPARLARAIVESVTHYNDPQRLAAISTGLGMSMKGESLDKVESVRTAHRGY